MRDKLETTGTHAVYRRVRDGRLVAMVGIMSDKTGKKTFRSKVMPKKATIADARRQAEALRDDAKDPAVKIRPPSLLAFSATWIARKVARGEWTPGSSTQTNVERHMTHHIGPVLGAFLLDRITTHDLHGWIDGQVASGAKLSSVRTRWITLKGLVADGCHEYGLPNPAERVHLPKGASMTRGGKDLTLMPDQVRALLEVAQKGSPWLWFPMLMLGFSTGARPGELVAVQVRDLDLTGEIGKWQIARHWVSGHIVEGTKQHEEGRPSYLDPQTTGVLRALVELRRTEAGDDAWLFPAQGKAKGGGSCVTEQGLWVWMQKRLDELGIPALSGKTFRQTHITLSSLAGIQQSLVMAQVGHNSKQVHAIYNRPPESPRQDAVRKLGQVIHLADRVSIGPSVGPTDLKAENS